ncbi:MAG: tandem-95 repeat protein [Candidatus Stygibacter australis]|nr:tandem-95 repeat protein [Candidatus Stygibacter australis]
MKNSMIFLVLLFVVSALFSNNDIVPANVIEDIAMRNAEALWGEVTKGDVIPYYYSDEEIVAYRYNFFKGDKFPDEPDISANEGFCSMLLSARRDMPVILQHSESLSHEYLLGDKLRSLAEEEIGKGYTLEKTYYLTTANVWYCVSNNGERKYIRVLPPAKVVEEGDFIEFAESIDFFCDREDYSAEWSAFESGERELTRSQVCLVNHEYMPFYPWHYGCGPTAAAMLLGWYDYNSINTVQNYSKLVDWVFAEVDGASIDYHVPNTSWELKEDMETDDIGGTFCRNMVSGTLAVTNDRNNYEFTGSRYQDHEPNWYFDRVRDYVQDGFPMMLWINENHFVTAMGYNETDNTVGVHDPNSSVIEWYDESIIGEAYTIIPGGGYGNAINLSYPHGDLRYYQSGAGDSGEVYAGTDICEISWQGDTPAGQNQTVSILYATDSEVNTANYIVNNIPDIGHHIWTVPNYIDSEKCRIWVRLYDQNGTLIGADGSYGDFTIIPGGSLGELPEDLGILTETDPDFFMLDHPTNNWGIAGVRSNDIYDNWGIRLYSDTSFSQETVCSEDYFRNVNFIAIDGNHTASYDMGVRVGHYDDETTSSNARVEKEGGAGENLVSGLNPVESWQSTDVVQIWDTYLNPGVYSISLDILSGSADLNIGFFSSQNSDYFQSIGDMVTWGASNGAGEDESISVTITDTDYYGVCVWSENDNSCTYRINIEGPGVWSGAVSTYWYEEGNWVNGIVPDEDTDVLIPEGAANYPVIGYFDTNQCRNLTVAEGASLTIGNRSLAVYGSANIHGEVHLASDGPQARLQLFGNVHWYGTSHLYDTAGGQINIQGSWYADAGAEVTLNYSEVMFLGSEDALIRINAENHVFYELIIYKQNDHEVVFSSESDQELEVIFHFYVYPGAEFRVLTEAAVMVHGTFSVNENAKVTFEEGTLNFVDASAFTPGITSIYKDINIVSGADMGMYGDIELESLVIDGSLSAEDIEIIVSGDWIRESGTFAGTNTTVIFNGENNNQYVNETNFNTVILDKDFGGELIVSNNNEFVCQSLEFDLGTVRVNGGSFIAEDLADPRVLGNYILESGTIDLHQGTTSFEYVDLDANIWIYEGEFNIHGGYPWPSEWATSRNITVYMEDGVLDFKDNGILISETGHELNDIITGGIIRTSGDFKVENDSFSPTGGQIELYGGGTAYCYNNSGSSFRNVRVNKGSGTREEEERDRLNRVIFNYDTTIDGDLVVEHGFIQINDITLSIGDDLLFYGGLNMDSEDDIINVADDVTWFNGSGAYVTDGEFHVGGNWTFYNGIDCEFEPCNVVYFDGGIPAYIYSYSTEACFGDVKIDKTNCQVSIHDYNNNTVQISGDLEVLSDNTFDVYGNELTVDGMIDLYTDSALTIDTGGELNVSNLVMQGNLYMYAGTVTVIDNFHQYSSGHIAIWEGDLILDMPYEGSHESINGYLVIYEGNMQVTNNGIQFGEDADFTQSHGTMKIGWGFRALYTETVELNGGSIEFIGSMNSQINLADDVSFNDVIINKSGTTGNCTMQSELQINGDLTLNDGRLTTGDFDLDVVGSVYIGEEGRLTAGNNDIQVGGDWTNEHGIDGFDESTSTVRFLGDIPAVINSDETFYDLEVFKQTGQNYYLELAEGKSVHALRDLLIYDGTFMLHTDCLLDVDRDITIGGVGGLNCYFLDENITIHVGDNFLDLNVEVNIMDGFIAGQSLVVFDGVANQTVQTYKEDFDFNDVIINCSGEYVSINDNINVLGDLQVMDGEWHNGGGELTHYFHGDVILCEDGWWDYETTVVFYGPNEAAYDDFGGGVTFNNVIIDKNPEGDRNISRDNNALTLASDLILLQGGDLTIESGTLICEGNEINCTGDVTINDGTLYLESDSELRVGNECALDVNAGGSLICMGTEEYPVEITSYDAGNYHELNINTDGTIAAEYTTFKYMSADGVYVTIDGIVEEDHAFNHCIFRDGIENGSLFKIRNDQELTCYDAAFPENTWGSSYNVHRNMNAGNLEFINASGAFSGESYDYDPYNRVDWIIMTPPEITVYADDPMDYGEIIVGEMGSIGIDIENTGTMDLTGTITTPEGYTVSFWARDGEEILNRNALAFTVEGEGLHSYRVDFEPTELMTYAGEIVIEHNADSDTEIVNVTGIGIPIPPPACEIWNEEFAFGDVVINESRTDWFNIYNSGGSTLEGSIAVPEGYTIDEEVWRSIDNPEEEHHRETMNTRNVIDLEIEPGYMVNFTLVFEPVELQEYNGVLAISHNAPGGETLIDITGRGVEAILSFDPYVLRSVLTPGETETQVLTLGNEGNLDINYLAYVGYENVNNIIINEGFEGDFPPTGWSTVTSGWENWYQSDYDAFNGDYCAEVSSMEEDVRITTSWFTATEDCLLRYWNKGNENYWEEWMTGSFQVEVTTNGSDWTVLSSISQEFLPYDWEARGIALGAYAGQNIKVSFHVLDNSMGRGAKLDDVVITGEANPTYQWISLNNASNVTGIIPAGNPAEEIQVTFNSAGLVDSDYYADVYLLSNDTSDPMMNISVAFNVGVYDMTVTPGSLDFGEIEAGTTFTQQFTLLNSGTLELDGVITMPLGYSVEEPMPGMRNDVLEYHLFQGNSFTYNAIFAPETHGNFDGDISISNVWNDAVELLPVTGTGLAPEMEYSGDMLFIEQQPGNTTTSTLTLSNNGNDDLEYSASVDYMRDNRDVLVSEGFENEFPPMDWYTEDLAMMGDWWQDMMYPHSGTYAAVADPYMMEDARLVSPMFTATADCQLSYFIRTYNQPDAGGNFGIEVSTDGMTWTFLDEFDLSTLTMTYQQRTLSLADYAGSNIQVAFRLYDNIDYFCAGALVDDVEITGSPVALDEWLTLNGEESVSGIIEPGNSEDILVGFDAEDLPEGWYMAEIVIDSNDPMMPQQWIMVEMNVGYPHISVYPDSLDFWDTVIGEETWQSFSIENMGSLTLTGDINIPEGFTVLLDTLNIFREGEDSRATRTTYPIEIDPWMNQNYYVIFAPEAVQSYGGELVITHNAPEDEIHIPLAGQGCSAPEVSTAEITEITEYSALGGGVVIHDGNNTVDTRGICWNEAGNPTIDMDMFTEDGEGLGEFVSEMQTLMPGTTYYVRAYATNFYGCGYGEEVSFVTIGAIMNISVENLPDFGNVGMGSFSVEASYTVSGTNMSDDIMIFAPMGFQVAIEDSRILVYSDMLNIEQMNGEVPETTVYVRFCPDMIAEYDDYIMHFTMNSQEKFVQVTGNGVIPPTLNLSVTELPDFGVIQTGMASASAMYSVSGIDLLGDVVITAPAGFEISLTPERGLQTRAGRSRNRTFSNELILVPENGMLEDMIYVHFLPQEPGVYMNYIVHEPAFGEPEFLFVSGTGICFPEVETAFVTGIDYISANGGGEVISDGNLDVTARGICWSTDSEPDLEDQITVDGEGVGSFTSFMGNLTEGTSYYVRAYATNSLGTAYGNQTIFTTLSPPEIELPESFSFAEDEELEIDFEMYLNDDDYDQLYLTVSGGVNISVDIEGFMVTFTASENWNGSEILTFIVSDNVTRAIAVDDVEIIVTSVNDAPAADAGGPYSGEADAGGTCEIMLNGTGSYDIDGDIATWQWIWSGNEATGSEPLAVFPIGNTEVVLTVTDNEGLSDTDTTQVIVTGYENIPPVAVMDSYYLMEDESVSGNVLDNDYDIDEYPLPLTAELLTGIEHGNLELLLDGNFSYQPDANWNGWEAFSYRIFDGAAYSESVNVDLFVSPVNDVPVIDLPESFTILEDGFLEVDFSLYIDDVDGDVILLTFPEPDNFSAIQEGLFIYFEPDENWHGSETITFTVNDGQSRVTASDEMTIIVTSVNDDPIADAGGPYEGIMYIPDTCEITLDGSGSYDPDDDIVQWLWSWESNEVSGEIVTGDFYLGSTEVMLTVTDSEGASHYDLAEVFITEYQNIAPVAIADEYYPWEDSEVTDNVMINDYDIDELPLPLIAELVDTVSHGTLEFMENGEFTYQPDPDYDEWDTFSYRIFDGVDYSETVNADFFISSVNDAPTIDLPESLTILEDGFLEIDFSQYIEDVDSDVILFTFSVPVNMDILENDLLMYFEPDENWHGSEVITFTVDDQQGRMTASDEVEIIVTSVNDLPIADAGDEYSGQADITGFCEIMLNGSGSYDIDGEIVSWEWNWDGGNAEGEEVLAEFPVGTTEVTLTVTDNETGIDTDIAQVIISSYDNMAPVAIADEYTLNEDAELSDNVMTNDFDPDESPLALIAELVSDVSNGTLDFADNGDFTYLPDLNWNGTDAFDYRVYDGEAYSETVIVTLIVNPVNDLPIVDAGEEYSGQADVTGFCQIMLNGEASYDIDGVIISWDWSWNGGSGSGEMLQATFPTGETIVELTVTDNEGGIGMDTTIVNITEYENIPPVAFPKFFEGDEDTTIMDSVLAYGYDYDPDEYPEALTAELVTNVTHGILEFNDDGTFSYVPEENWNGDDMFTYRAYDGMSFSEETGIFLTVIPVNDSPVMLQQPDDLYLLEDFEPYMLNLEVYYEDIEGDELFFYLDYNEEAINIVEQRSGVFEIVSVQNWYGESYILIEVTDGDYWLMTYIMVYVESVNDAPTIELPESFTFTEDGMLEVDFVNYVNDVDAADIEDLVLSVSEEANLIVEINGLNVTFTADANWFGNETLTFTIDDQQSRATASDDVEIIVTPVNDLPIADAGEGYSGQADVSGFCEIILNGSGSYDIDGEIVSWQWTWEGGNTTGEEVLAEFPAGTTEVTLTVTDNEAGVATDIAQIIVSGYDNLAPVAVSDEYALNEDAGLSDNVMTNDYDPDESPLALIPELVSDVSNGALDFADNGDFTYLPDLNWNGTDAFSYRVYDGEDYSDTVIVTLIVNPVNDAPEITAYIPVDLGLFVTIESSASTANVAFALTVEDVDNETLTYNWYINDDLESSSSLNAFDYDFGVGNYIVTGEVTDSEFFDTVTWNIFVYSSMGDLEDAEIAVNNLILDPEDPEPAIVSTSPLVLAWNVTSYNFALSFDNNVIAYDGHSVVGTLSENATILITDNGDNIDVEATSVSVLEGGGALIEFYFSPIATGFSNLEITDFNYNETYIMNITNGSVTVGNYPPELILPLYDYNKLEDFVDFEIDLSDHFTDQNDDVLDYSAEYESGEIGVSINGEILTISSVSNWFGIAEFTIIATDSQGAFCFDTAVVNISPVNDAPTIELPDSFTFVEDGSLEVDFANYVNDVDNVDLMLMVTGEEHINVDISDLIVTFTSEAGWSGSEVLIFTIDDNQARSTDFDDVEIIVTPGTGITLSKDLIPGWNWLSLNIAGDDMSVNNVLSTLGNNAASIKSQTQSAIYYDGMGWFGSLTEINNFTFYKLNALNNVTWEYTGLPVDPQSMIYSLTTGWNWISYAPQTPEDINFALAALDNAGISIKSQTQSSIYYEGMGWFGSLTQLQPLGGYMLNANTGIEFSYPQPVARHDNFTLNQDESSRDFDLYSYEFNGTMVLSSDDPLPENSSIAAFVDGEKRSICKLLDYSSIFGKCYYSLMLYSNYFYEDDFELYYQESENNQLQPIDYRFSFQADMTCGDYLSPVMINLPLGNSDPLPASNLLTVYPNPFNPETNIHFELAEPGTALIEIYNVKGQKLETLLNCELPAGKHSLIWNPQNQSSGIYLLNFKTSDTMLIRKLILLK